MDDRQIEKEKKQLLRMMKKMPHQPRIKWAIALGWINLKDKPDDPRIVRRLEQLVADGLVVKIGHRYLVKA